MATLTAKQARFVEEYLVDLNATQAAIRAGYSGSTAYSIGYENLRKPQIADAIERARSERSEHAKITAEDVLSHWWSVGKADPNALVQYRRNCCRHCWGQGFRYQYTPAEYDRVRLDPKAQVERDENGFPDRLGGLDFNGRREPNPDCVECFGEGSGRLHAQDTRALSPAARLLYKGAKRTKDGLEIMLHDQAKALENVARHLGMFEDKRDKPEETADMARRLREFMQEADSVETGQ